MDLVERWGWAVLWVGVMVAVAWGATRMADAQSHGLVNAWEGDGYVLVLWQGNSDDVEGLAIRGCGGMDGIGGIEIPVGVTGRSVYGMGVVSCGVGAVSVDLLEVGSQGAVLQSVDTVRDVRMYDVMLSSLISVGSQDGVAEPLLEGGSPSQAGIRYLERLGVRWAEIAVGVAVEVRDFGIGILPNVPGTAGGRVRDEMGIMAEFESWGLPLVTLWVGVIVVSMGIVWFGSRWIGEDNWNGAWIALPLVLGGCSVGWGVPGPLVMIVFAMVVVGGVVTLVSRIP